MRRKGVPEDVVDEVLVRFTEVGLVDDRGFASALSASQSRRLTSARVLRQKLREKGVEAEIIDETLAERDPEADLEAARALVLKRQSALQGVDRSARYRRLAGLLSRRGFGSSVISRAIREAEADSIDDQWVEVE
ncbi:MAG: regulatory protein RecX [Micropruina sp.]|nr:RecX family transcriptional regulator [Micropruina sp.]